jgi:hypothetical protein
MFVWIVLTERMKTLFDHELRDLYSCNEIKNNERGGTCTMRRANEKKTGLREIRCEDLNWIELAVDRIEKPDL